MPRKVKKSKTKVQADVIRIKDEVKLAPQPSPAPPEKSVPVTDFLLLGHLMKYNLYMVSKALVFGVVSDRLSKSATLEDVVAETNKIMLELDLDTKQRMEASKKMSETSSQN